MLQIQGTQFGPWSEASLVGQTVKSLPAVQESQVQSLGLKMPWRRKWQTTPLFLPGKSHGWRNLGGYSPSGHKELEWLSDITFFQGTRSHRPQPKIPWLSKGECLTGFFWNGFSGWMGWDGWMASLTRWTQVWACSGVGDGQGSLACCSPWGRKELDMTEQLN